TKESASIIRTSKAPLVNFSELEPLLSPKNDTTYLFNFWATWCKPCVEELPFFEELYKEKAGEPFKMYLISLDFPKQIEKKLIPFMDKHQLTGEVMVINDPDANTWIDKVSPEWSGAIPATLIVRGDQRTFHEGKLSSKEEIENLISQL
ncbi:MAG: TlpA family protein disulfide reductase, partial [Saprospiraceae bacterium]|nr:TlpA family protein disulfide reductase [Saprospiraceae bacterium]